MGSGGCGNEAQSVSSETDEEDSSESVNPVPDGIRSSKKLKRPSTTATGRNVVARIQGRNEDRSTEPVSPSPEVTKGGENEFVKVSQIASIEVNEVAQKHPPVRALQRKNTPPKFAKTTATSTTNLSSEGNDVESSVVDEGFRSRTRTRNSQEVSTGGALDDDVSVSAPMDVIEKSPYEHGMNAEKGEKIFEEIKRLLKEDSNDDGRSVNPETTKIFGSSNGWLLVKASALIDKSGITYSQEWVTGNIRGHNLGTIPNYLLLLCLVSNRFVKAGDHLLSGLCRDMEVYSMINDALSAWGMDDEYKLIFATTKNFTFTLRKRDCFKCAIFVARVYACSRVFGKNKKTLGSRLMDKVKVCLDIMEDCLGERQRLDGVSTSGYSHSPVPQVVMAVRDDQDQPTKRKRGRPSKQDSTEDVAVHPKEKKKDERKPESVEVSTSLPRNRQQSKHSAGTAQVAAVEEPEPTLTQLIGRFEDEYEQMGQRYEAMGELLEQMRTTIEQRRERSEQQIRNEVLEEVQKSILSSMPKK